MSSQPSPPTAPKADPRPAGRWDVRAKRDKHGLTGYFVVDSTNDQPIAAVLPESKNDKKHAITRQRRAWAIALELHELDLETEAQLEGTTDDVAN